MRAYSLWFFEKTRKKSPIQYFVHEVLIKLNRLYRRAVRVKQPSAEELREKWQERALFLEPALQRAKLNRLSHQPRVVHLIGSLQSGGAERQLCNCVIGMKRLGYDVTVMLIYKPINEHGHYAEFLYKEGVTVRVVGESVAPRFEAAVRNLPGGEACWATIPVEFRNYTTDILGELVSDPPDIFHSWLDLPNIWGGVAALFANIPLIVLSTRNVNPTHFPNFAYPYCHAIYTQLARSPNVRFINNSYAGAEDYAKWLDMPKERFSVILNGVEFNGLSRASDQQISNFRKEVGIAFDKEIVAGVFRLSEEKQPFVFLDVIRRVIKRRPTVIAVIGGIGPLEQELKNYIGAHHLENRVFLLGRRTDVATIFSAATLKLLCSRQEGTPNVLLEAQWLGCPVVSTKAGGAVDAVSDGETGFLVDVGNVDGLEGAVMELLENVSLRSRMAEAGPPYIRNHFSMDRMVQETLSIYNTLGE